MCKVIVYKNLNDVVFYDADGFEQQYYGGSFTVASGGSVVRNDTIAYDGDGFEKTWNGGNFTVASPNLTVIGDLSALSRMFVTGDTSLNGNLYTDGKIGIGTTPQFPLDVSGVIKGRTNLILGATTFTDPFLKITGGIGAGGINGMGNVEMGIATLKGDWSTYSNSGDFVIRTDASHSLILQTGYSAAAICISNNLVGIGNSNPSYTLDVNGMIRSNNPYIMMRSTIVDGNATTHTMAWDTVKAQRGGTMWSSANNSRIVLPQPGVYQVYLSAHTWYSGANAAHTQTPSFTLYNSAGTAYGNGGTGSASVMLPYTTFFPLSTTCVSALNSDNNGFYNTLIYAYAANDYLVFTVTTSITTQMNYNGNWNSVTVYLVQPL